jgi:hypothetical protein
MNIFGDSPEIDKKMVLKKNLKIELYIDTILTSEDLVGSIKKFSELPICLGGPKVDLYTQDKFKPPAAKVRQIISFNCIIF